MLVTITRSLLPDRSSCHLFLLCFPYPYLHHPAFRYLVFPARSVWSVPLAVPAHSRWSATVLHPRALTAGSSYRPRTYLLPGLPVRFPIPGYSAGTFHPVLFRPLLYLSSNSFCRSSEISVRVPYRLSSSSYKSLDSFFAVSYRWSSVF